MIESKLKAKNCNHGQLFDLVESRQHGVASNKVISLSTDHSYPLNADGNDLRWNSNPNLCRLANVTCKTRDKGQHEKFRISCCCRDKETAKPGKWMKWWIFFSNDTGILGKNPITARLLFWVLCEDHFSFYLMSAVDIWFISYTLFTFISSFTVTYEPTIDQLPYQRLRSSAAGKASYRHREVTAGTNPVEILNFFSGFFPYYCVHNCEDHLISFPL